MNNKEAKLQQLAKDIIRNNIYMTLATTDKMPWASPVFYCKDHKFNFYYISLTNSTHAQNIAKNSRVAFAIFDSHQKEGTGIGVQGYGTAKQLKGFEIIEGLRHYRTSFIALNLAALRKAGYYRLYKITPEHFYVLDPDAPVDKRVEVKIY
jgi:uncharacterized protein YhbP (UPF0306 family)